MKTLTYLAILLAILIGCDNSTEPSAPTVSAFQVRGCLGTTSKGLFGDSCFVYRFRETLLVQFCATANCCPDSNRFAFRHSISHDTIFVTIADTAAHLCRCNCSYTLEMEIAGLDKDSYSFYCTREDYSSQLLLYLNRVQRD